MNIVPKNYSEQKCWTRLWLREAFGTFIVKLLPKLHYLCSKLFCQGWLPQPATLVGKPICGQSKGKNWIESLLAPRLLPVLIGFNSLPFHSWWFTCTLVITLYKQRRARQKVVRLKQRQLDLKLSFLFLARWLAFVNESHLTDLIGNLFSMQNYLSLNWFPKFSPIVDLTTTKTTKSFSTSKPISWQLSYCCLVTSQPVSFLRLLSSSTF